MAGDNMSNHQFINAEDILRLAETDHEYAEWQKTNSFPVADWTDIHTSRVLIEAWITETFDALGDPGMVMDIPMRDGHQSALRVYRLEPSTQELRKSPLIVLLHGGAFVTGDPRELAQYAIALRGLFNATVAIPSYRLAPEHPFPTAQQDVWDALTWLESQAGPTFGVDLSHGFVLGGVSAGANMAAAICQRWSEEVNKSSVTGLWLSMPFVFSSIQDVPAGEQYAYLSRAQNATAPMNGEITSAAIAAQKPDTTSPLYSPFNSRNPHKPLAQAGVRVYFQTSGQDSYRDDALIYERTLRSHGVDTKLDVYRGLPHAHFALIPSLTESRRCNLDTLQQFGWLLGQDIPMEETIRLSVYGIDLR